MDMTFIDQPCPSVHFEAGKENRVAIVFSCPGRHEEAAGRPAAGTTGRNLETLLSLLNQLLRRDDLSRANVTITNAWPHVEYRTKTGRSEASRKELLEAKNLERLRQELEEISDMVIFCGEKARIVSMYLELEHHPTFVYIDHLGLRGLCSIRRDVNGQPIVAVLQGSTVKVKKELQRENTRKRLAVVASSIQAQLQQSVH